MKNTIQTPHAPKAIGPYSQAIEANGTLYVSGQLPVDPTDGSIPMSVSDQTERCLDNIGAILNEAGYTFDDVVKCTVLLDDIGNFGAMNEVYSRFFSGTFPARVCYEVSKLPKEVMVEIDVIAVK